MSLILPDTPVLTGNTDQKLFVIRSYLCELSERLQMALWNMGEDSLSPSLQQKLNQIATDAKAAGEKIVSREEAAQKEFKTLMDRIVETAESVTLSFETSLQEQEDRIVSQVQETYAARSELGELEEHLSSSITQTAEDLTATFTQIASVTAREEVENQSINAYFRFSADGLLIGRTVGNGNRRRSGGEHALCCPAGQRPAVVPRRRGGSRVYLPKPAVYHRSPGYR